jgi:isopentenyldiphosphate isomerase
MGGGGRCSRHSTGGDPLSDDSSRPVEQDEVLEVLDDSMRPKGLLSRADVHRLGCWHRTFHCWVVTQHDDRLRVLFQRRAQMKPTYPGRLDTSSAGHVLGGESVVLAGTRELREELGLEVSSERLSYMGERLDVWEYGNDVLDREVCSFFVVRVTIDEIIFDEIDQAEVDHVYSADLTEAIDFFGHRRRGLHLDCLWPIGRGVLEVSYASEFFPHSSGYYLSSLIAARDYFTGAKIVSV